MLECSGVNAGDVDELPKWQMKKVHGDFFNTF